MTGGTARRTGMTVLAALMALLAWSPAVRAGVVTRFANGIEADIHGPEEILDSLLVERDGGTYLEHPQAGAVELESAKNAAWLPFDAQVVADALAAMTCRTDVHVDVFILPAPPSGTMSSFARRGAIFLAPAVGDVAKETVAYITAHELGHVLTWAFMDGQPGRWDAYLAMRGLDANVGPDVRHADQPREILAEDLRYLFGGRLATSSGSIENHDLILPDRVDGLRDLLAGFLAGRASAPALVASSAWPNPCNPLTTVEMVLPAGAAAAGDAELRIFDVRGSLVRCLHGGTGAGGRVAIQWHGDDERGGAAASGRYLYVMKAAGLTARGSVTLVR